MTTLDTRALLRYNWDTIETGRVGQIPGLHIRPLSLVRRPPGANDARTRESGFLVERIG